MGSVPVLKPSEVIAILHSLDFRKCGNAGHTSNFGTPKDV